MFHLRLLFQCWYPACWIWQSWHRSTGGCACSWWTCRCSRRRRGREIAGRSKGCTRAPIWSTQHSLQVKCLSLEDGEYVTWIEDFKRQISTMITNSDSNSFGYFVFKTCLWRSAETLVPSLIVWAVLPLHFHPRCPPPLPPLLRVWTAQSPNWY